MGAFKVRWPLGLTVKESAACGRFLEQIQEQIQHGPRIPMIIFGPCINFLLLMVPTSQTLGPKGTGDHHLEDHLKVLAKIRGIMHGGPAGKCERLGKTSFCFCNCQRLVSGARRVHPLSPRRAAGYRVNPPERVQG